jgi:hypothetical protein
MLGSHIVIENPSKPLLGDRSFTFKASSELSVRQNNEASKFIN